MRVLIADDDAGTRLLLAKALAPGSFEIVTAIDGNGAWETLAAGDGPGLALIDWTMPGIDGLELCRRVREQPALRHMYLILLTGRDRREDVIAGLNAGADDYIVKPFDIEELRARVRVGMRVLSLQYGLEARVAELQQARDELSRQANTDALTGLCSRRHWLTVGETEVARARRYGHPLSVLMIDLDFFKNVNDTHGHSVGDEVLSRFADILRQELRTSDVLGRLGGEEFSVLMPNTSAEDALHAAGRVAGAWRQVAFPTIATSLSCSIGVSELASSDTRMQDVLKRADEALYDAKRGGRDRVELAVSI